jgi:2,3-bisphosphoglycerate-independent phosphoglycerate mutase
MTNESSVLLFFIDGLGIGRRIDANPFHNLSDATPLAVFQNERAQSFLDGIVVPTDPTLGVDGRPQSASGQTTILTGINAPLTLGYHKQGFPNQALLEIIREHSIFRRLKEAHVEPITFANAYTSRFFETRPRWVSATTAAVEAAGLSFRTVDDLKNDNAVYQDFTNRLLIERGELVQERGAEEASAVLARIAAQHRFTLYEYFITDKVGHSQDMPAAKSVLTVLAEFIRRLLMNLDLKRTTVILTSDHGNIEDLSSRNHTLHKVPTIVWGRNREMTASRIKNLADITPAIVDLLTETSST